MAEAAGRTRYRILHVPVEAVHSPRGYDWEFEFTPPDGWELKSVLGEPRASTRTGGWDHITVLLEEKSP